jgi:paraquat-inducible protein B
LDFAKQDAELLESLTSLLNRVTKAQTLVNTLDGIEDVQIPDSAIFISLKSDADKHGELSSLQVRLSRAQNLVDKLNGISDLQDPPDGEVIDRYLTALVFAEDLRRRYQATEQKTLDLDQELKDSVQQEADVEAELSNVLGTWGECPVCGTSFQQCEHT